MMKAIAAIPGEDAPRFVDCPSPQLNDGEVLCRTLQLGVCGTDREILASKTPSVPSGEEYLVLGHECLAVVEEVTPGARGISVGDLVAPAVRRPIGEPRFRSDMLSPGSYIERGIIAAHGFSQPVWVDRPEFLFPVPREIESIAVFAEPLSVTEKAVNEAMAVQHGRLGPTFWKDQPPRVLVTGMGPIGFAGLLSAIVRGWDVTMYGRDKEDTFRSRLAREFGAKYIQNLPAPEDYSGFDLILECTGATTVLIDAAGALAARGVMVWLGASRQPRPESLKLADVMRRTMVGNQIHLGSVNAADRDFRLAIEHLTLLCRNKAKEVASLLTSHLSVDDALWHYTNRTPQGIKAVVHFA